MQIVGVDYDDDFFRCSRIQNIDKPEFQKFKQFKVDKKGMASLMTWLKECCSGDCSSMVVALPTLDATGMAVATLLYSEGFVIAPITRASVFKAFMAEKQRKTPAEITATLALGKRREWHPVPTNILNLRSALFEREEARTGMQQNEARNEKYTGQSFDFLMQLTQNAANIHADRVQAADDKIRSIIETNPDLKKDFDRLMTIPCMTSLAAQSLVSFIHAYPCVDSRHLASCLGLVDGSRLTHENYRIFDQRVVRSSLYSVAEKAIDEIPSIQKLSERLQSRGCSHRTILVAAMHKIVRIAFGMLKSQTNYASN